MTKPPPPPLQDAAEALLSDREFVLEAIASDIRASQVLRLASSEIRADLGVVTEAIRRDGFAPRWASPDLQADKNLAVSANVMRFSIVNLPRTYVKMIMCSSSR